GEGEGPPDVAGEVGRGDHGEEGEREQASRGGWPGRHVQGHGRVYGNTTPACIQGALLSVVDRHMYDVVLDRKEDRWGMKEETMIFFAGSTAFWDTLAQRALGPFRGCRSR
ncbi:unnamed protein product, partial [Ectocarpus sp. 8 AP-2014]